MQPSATFDDVVTTLSKLSNNVEYLERAVQTLAARLRLSDQERFEPAEWNLEIQKLMVERMPKSLPAALIGMENTLRHIRDAELHLNAIRSGIDDLLNDAGAMKTWRHWQGLHSPGGES